VGEQGWMEELDGRDSGGFEVKNGVKADYIKFQAAWNFM
jgi:hypothetical protein